MFVNTGMRKIMQMRWQLYSTNLCCLSPTAFNAPSLSLFGEVFFDVHESGWSRSTSSSMKHAEVTSSLSWKDVLMLMTTVGWSKQRLTTQLLDGQSSG
jgi:hypothetical protein